jgi:hypothetical protein
MSPAPVTNVIAVGDDEAALFGAWAVEHVERESVVLVLRIERDHVVFQSSRYVVR